MAEERICRRDSEWASIEGKLCLVTAFVPMSGNIVKGAIVARDQTVPYARVRLTTADYDGDITGYIRTSSILRCSGRLLTITLWHWTECIANRHCRALAI